MNLHTLQWELPASDLRGGSTDLAGYAASLHKGSQDVYQPWTGGGLSMHAGLLLGGVDGTPLTYLIFGGNDDVCVPIMYYSASSRVHLILVFTPAL